MFENMHGPMGIGKSITVELEDKVLGITRDQWIIIRLLFEAINDKRMQQYAVTNRHFTLAIVNLHQRLGRNKFYEAIGMLHAERRQTQKRNNNEI